MSYKKLRHENVVFDMTEMKDMADITYALKRRQKEKKKSPGYVQKPLVVQFGDQQRVVLELKLMSG